MLKIYIDGDACPVKDEVIRVATRYNLEIFIVSNQGFRTNFGPSVKAILVGREFDAADNWIVDQVRPDDIVITTDIPLAARCLKKAALAVSPSGKVFTPENIGSALARRELNSYLRDTGEIVGHNPTFTKRDRSNFLQALDVVIIKTLKKDNGAYRSGPPRGDL